MNTHHTTPRILDIVFILPIVVPMEDAPLHTAAQPFCSDLKCPCHEDYEACADLNRYYFAGLLTLDEYARIYAGGAA